MPRFPVLPSSLALRIAFGVTLVAAGLLALPWRSLQTAEDLSLDLRLQLRGGGSGDQPGIIVGVADSSFSLAERASPATLSDPVLGAMTPAWPWDRHVFAATVKRLREAGARLIVFDIVFAGATAADADFAAVLAEPGAPVVLASWWQVEHDAADQQSVRLLEPAAPLAAAVQGRTGFANVWPDRDGGLRRACAALAPEDLLGLPPPTNDANPPVPSLALAAALALGGDRPIPSEVLIDYHWPPGTIPSVPIEDLFLADQWNGDFLRQGALFRDQVVWVGPLSEIRFKDMHHTAFGQTAGVAVQAQLAATLAAGSPLRPLVTQLPARAALIVGLGLLGLASAARARRAAVQAGWIGVGAVLWSGTCVGAFVVGGWVLPWVAPLLAWLIGAGSGAGSRLVFEQQERQRLRATLGRYVSEEVAALIVDEPEAFSAAQQGVRRDITVLFVDLQGFTGWVETASPEAFVAQLNEYFTAVVDCVLAQGGTLQKFIGDAVLAAWGDTRSAGPTEDSRRAFAAALGIRDAVQNLNRQWQNRADRTPLRVGIGLHHGPAMIGTVGHPQRREFTVLGDAVNIAARLESANRQLHTDILLSASVRAALAAEHTFVPLGPVRLKGRREPVELFTPLAPPPSWLPLNNEALAAWQSGDSATAAAIWTKLAQLESPLAGYFAFRAQQIHAHPPAATAAGRDGAWELETK